MQGQLTGLTSDCNDPWVMAVNVIFTKAIVATKAIDSMKAGLEITDWIQISPRDSAMNIHQSAKVLKQGSNLRER